ncbi:hypothetical protein GCM10010215_66430 [Streptomyces virginiae]|nr:NAD(P)-binding domain-containing protein [Streptomyces virginiae]GGQ33098.1 hypothetical protein GCM10010215_66430 [Streptomyces virginiae]
MRTGIIGTGRIGTVLARILVAAGHQVVLAGALALARFDACDRRA